MDVLSKNPRKIHTACKEAVVDSVLNNLSARLSGRGEFYDLIYGAKPSAVLITEFIMPRPLDERDNDEEADPIQISAHGLDMQVATHARSEKIAVAIRGAVYVRILPTADEVKPGAILEPTFPLNKEARTELKKRVRDVLAELRQHLGMTAKGAKMHVDWAKRSAEARRNAHEQMGIPFDNALDRTSADKPEDEESPQATGGEGVRESEAPPPAEARAGTTLPDNLAERIGPPPKWLRLELELPAFEFTVANIEKDAAAASAALNGAIAEQLQEWAQSAEEPYGGKLWGYRRAIPICPSDARNWSAYLERVRKDNKAPVVPTIDLRWDLRAVPDPLDTDRLSVHIAVENWSEPTTSQNHKELEPSLFQLAITTRIPSKAHCFLRLDRVKPSYRYNQYLQYPALGFNGGVTFERLGEENKLTTTWSPRYILPRINPTDRASQGVCSNIALLARKDCLKGLEPIVTAYEAWLKEAESYPADLGLEGPNAEAQRAKEREKLQIDLAAWRSELNAIRAGIEILKKSSAHWEGPGPQKDPRGNPFEAWLSMNAAMAKVAKSKGYTDWRLFQLAFILASIPAFATRIPEFYDFYTPEVAEYSNGVTLLYFATGGGKSEAFFGLLVFVLFLDRLRGKLHGVSALMRYPLRLLTLQQARRTFNTMGAAEEVRHERRHPGEVFSLGYWVGGTNTPNWHREEGYSSVPTVNAQAPETEGTYQEETPYKTYKERWLKLDGCPFCGSKNLALRRAPDRGGNALGHFCTTEKSKCSWNARFSEPSPLPFYVVDEDIYALAPSVLLGTVDKLSALGQSQRTIRKFFAMFSFAPLIENDTERLYVPARAKDWEGEPGGKTRPLYPSYSSGEKRFYDPFPSLLIQDEAHLLDESLGTFSGLFETALDAAFDNLAPLLGDQIVCEPGSTVRRKLKVIAASATVNEPQRQMRNLYQRGRTVQFPHPGPHLYQSFYAEPEQPENSPEDAERRTMPVSDVELRSHWARVYAAVLTNGHRHTVAMASVLGHYHLIITGLYERLRSGDVQQTSSARDELLRWVSTGPLQPQHTRVLRDADAATLLTLVDLHRISLTYVTNKKGGDQVIDTEKVQFAKLHQDNDYPEHTLSSELISGAVSAAEIQAIVRRAEDRVKPNLSFPDLNGTLRSIIATSAVSHGVDVEEFNAMFFAGMPSDIAEYIQASSRVGRTHVGFSLLVPVPQRYRDRFILEIHDIFHRFLERMILPAAVDRWAEKALVRVLPSFFQEFVCGVNAIKEVCGASDSAKPACRTYAHATDARDFLSKPAAQQETERFLVAALGLGVSPPPEGAPYYRALLRKQLAEYRQDMETERLVNSLLRNFFEARNANLRPMTSLRDVDQPGVIHESGIDASSKPVPQDMTARVMQFIRRGSGADIDDVDAVEEAKD